MSQNGQPETPDAASEQHHSSAASAEASSGDWSRSTYAPMPKAGQTRACNDPWTFVQVLGNGQTRPCCFSGLVLGYVSEETSFEQVYNGETAQNLRRELLTGELDRFCKICNMKSIVPVKEFQQQIAKLYDQPALPQGRPQEAASALLPSEEVAMRMQYAPPKEIGAMQRFARIGAVRRFAKKVLPYSLRDWINRRLAA